MSEPQSQFEAERVLQELETETLARIEAAGKTANAPVMDSSVGRLTYIDAYQQQQVALHGLRQLESQLAAIRAALQRVKEGTYGVCVGCGNAIPPERLEFVPEAPYCVPCKERLGR